MSNIDLAIISLAPEAQFVTTNSKITEWLSTDIPQPSDAPTG